jgi:hypothetical protein
MQIGGDLFIGTAAEQHFSYEHHEKFGGDIAKAAVGGMITGLASGLAFAGGGAIGATLGQGGAFVGLSQAAVTGITTYGGMAASYGSAAMTGLSTPGSTQMMSHNQRLNSLEQSTVLQAASNINVGNNLSIVTNDDLTISASNVTTENDAILKSIAGNVNIVSATENTTTTKRDITTSGFKDLAFSHTNSSASVGGSYTVTDRTTTVNTNTEKGSQLNIGGNLGIMAENDINIIASDILANKDIYMKAQTGDINILSAEQLQTIYDKMGIDTITAGLSVSNKWLGAADSMYKTTQSVLNVDSAPDVVNTFFQLDQGYNSYKKTTESIKKMTDAIDKGQSFGDLATWENAGFSLSGNLTMSHTEVETNITNTTHKGSSIISKTGDIDLDAEGNIRVEGSSIKTLSGENDKGNITLTANTGDIYIGATENTSERSTTSSTSGSTVNVNVNYIGKSEEQDKEKLDKSAKNNNQNTRDPNKEYVNLSGGITSFYKGSSTQSSSTSHNNSVISSANKTNLDTSSGGGNIILEGVNMNSENSTTLNAGSGNVTIASTQDTSSSDSNSYNASYGNALVAGIGASNSDVVKNNYSTVTSENGNVKIIANDLTLTGIKDDIRDNLNTDSVTGNITENQLMEKNKSDSYDIKIAVPLSKKPLWSYDIEVGGEESPKSEDIKNNVSEETKYSAFNLSELAARLKETSLSYKDSNGYDFKGSYNSIENSLEASHKIWTAPNTIIGLGNLGLNAAYGLAIGDPIKIDHKDGIWQVTNAKLNAKNGIAVTLGHVITYYDTYAPGNTVHSYDGTFLVDLEKHEKRHVTQSDILGPLFLPAYFSLGGISKHNLLEKDADNASRIEYNVYR